MKCPKCKSRNTESQGDINWEVPVIDWGTGGKKITRILKHFTIHYCKVCLSRWWVNA